MDSNTKLTKRRLVPRTHPYDMLGKIAGPKEAMARCSTPRQYAARHVQQMTNLIQGYPNLGFKMPWPADDGAVPYAAGGKWIIRCECGEYPIASLEWNEARCFLCGAIYRKLAWPRKIAEIEAELLRRPNATTRTWHPHETVTDLVRQREHEEAKVR